MSKSLSGFSLSFSYLLYSLPACHNAAMIQLHPLETQPFTIALHLSTLDDVTWVLLTQVHRSATAATRRFTITASRGTWCGPNRIAAGITNQEIWLHVRKVERFTLSCGLRIPYRFASIDIYDQVTISLPIEKAILASATVFASLAVPCRYTIVVYDKVAVRLDFEVDAVVEGDEGWVSRVDGK